MAEAVDGLLDVADQKESSGLDCAEQFFLYPIRVLIFVHINLGKLTPVLPRNFARLSFAARPLLPEKRKRLVLEVRKIQQIFLLLLCPVTRGKAACKRNQRKYRLRIAALASYLRIAEVLCRLFERLLPEFAKCFYLLRELLVAVLLICFQPIERLKRPHGLLCRRIAFRAAKRPYFFTIAVHSGLVAAEPPRLAEFPRLLRRGQ